MNQHMLTNYGIIRSFHDNGKSVIDTLLPFVEYGLSQIIKQNHEHYDKTSLKQVILETTGIRIQDLTLTNLLKKFEKAKVLKLYDQNQFFHILQDKKIQVSDYLEKIESFARKINHFISEYKKFSNDERSEEDVKEYLFGTLECKESKYGSRANDNNVDYSKYDKMFGFIQHIEHQNDDLFRIFQDINFGYTLCSLVEREDQIDKIKLKDFVIYLDSNFILRLLDLQEECYSNETKELFDLLSKSGAKIKVFEETLDEVINVIEFYKNRYIQEKDEIQSIVQAAHINGVYGAFFRRGLTVSQIDDIVDKLYVTIESLDIEIDQIERYKLIPNEDEITALYEKKYYDEETSQSDKYRRNKCKNYISIIQIIKWIRNRNKIRATCFGNSKVVFLTCDWRLYRYNLNGRNTRNCYPEIVIQESIVDNLMLFFPEGYDKISTELVLSVFQSSQYLNVNDLKTFSENIKTIIEEDPQMTSYVIKTTKNIDNYDDIARLYNDTSQDTVEGLKGLVIEQRKKDELEQQKSKQEQEKQLSSTYEKGRIEGFEKGEEKGYQKGQEAGYKQGEEIGIQKGREEGVKEGEQNALRRVAAKKAKSQRAIKIIGIAFLSILSIVFSVLLVLNIIKIPDLQVNSTTTLIISIVFPLSITGILTVLGCIFRIDEERIYNKLQNDQSLKPF